jgi:uncharacterized protein (DUF952 family)
MVVYKICPSADWQQAGQDTVYHGSSDDLRDGFVHLSASHQIEGTLARHFSGRTGLSLIAFQAERLGATLRWEASRGGDRFPHLYGPLPVEAAIATWPLELGADGRHVLPVLPDAAGPSA